MVVLVGAFDLSLTILAHDAGTLVELNPIAATLLSRWGAAGLAIYRITTLVVGCTLLAWGLRMYRLRRFPVAHQRRVRRVVWTSQLLLVSAHAALVMWWLVWLSR
jgi:hypothetical protein